MGIVCLWTSRDGGRAVENSSALATTAEDIQGRQQSYASRSFETVRDDTGDGARSIALGGASDVVFVHHGARDAAFRNLHLDPYHGCETSVSAPLLSPGFGFFFASSLS